MPRVCINVTGRNSQPYRFSLDRKIVRLGRAADNDIIIECPSVSSHHCEMRRVEGGYILQDLDSTNGIKVDDTRMEVVDLENDMEIMVGDAEMEFELTEEERETLSGEDHARHGRTKLPPLAEEDDEEDEEDGKEEEKAPRKKPMRRAVPAPGAPERLSRPAASPAANFFITIIFLFLSAVAFFVGMSLKHKNQTDRSLWDDLFGNPAPVEETQE